jgi:hypothetical protein
VTFWVFAQFPVFLLGVLVYRLSVRAAQLRPATGQLFILVSLKTQCTFVNALNPDLGLLLAFLLVMAVTTLSFLLTYHYIEKLGIQLGRVLIARFLPLTVREAATTTGRPWDQIAAWSLTQPAPLALLSLCRNQHSAHGAPNFSRRYLFPGRASGARRYLRPTVCWCCLASYILMLDLSCYHSAGAGKYRNRTRRHKGHWVTPRFRRRTTLCRSPRGY